MTALYPLLSALIVMSVSLVGVFFISGRVGAWVRRHMALLATFSAGVLSMLAYNLVGETIEHAPSLGFVAASIAAGVVILEIVHALIPGDHHHHEATEHAHSKVDGRRVLISDAVHNVTDGLLIVTAFAADMWIGWAATLGIMVHEAVQETSEFFVLKHAGYGNRRALMYNALTSSTILIGVAVGFFLSSSTMLLALLTGFAAGGFISVVFRDLIPNTLESARLRGTWRAHLVAALAGVLVMFSLGVLLPHAADEAPADAHIALT